MRTAKRFLFAALMLVGFSSEALGDVTVKLQGNYTVTTGTSKISIPTSWMQAGHAYTLTTGPVGGNWSVYGDPYLWSVVYVNGSSTRRIVYQSRHDDDEGERAHLQEDMWNTGEDKAEFWIRCEVASCYMRLTVYEREEGTFDDKTFYREGVEYRVIDGQYSLYKDFYHPTEKSGDYGLQVDYEGGRYLYLHRSDDFDTSNVNALSFWIRSGGSIGEDDLTIALTTGDHYMLTSWTPLSSYVTISESHTWYRVLIPLSDLNPSDSSVRGLAIMSDRSGFVYFDDVELVSETIPLLWPLEGGFRGGPVTSLFGDDWDNSYCNGLIKKHTGFDVSASVNDEVRSAMSGIVRDVFSDPKWGGAVVVEDESGDFTVVYWHINAWVSENDSIDRGDIVGTIANIDPRKSHLHFGYRKGPYNAQNSLAGSLPQTACGGYPAFPEKFVDPETLNFDSW